MSAPTALAGNREDIDDDKTDNILLIAAVAAVASPAFAQRLGAGGTMIDDQTAFAHCATSYGTVSLVEDKQAASPDAALAPQIAAYLALARSQGGGDADPIPLLKLLVSRSGCFVVVDRGAGFSAVQRERELANAGQVATQNGATITPSNYVLVAQMVYANGNAGGAGGALGGFGGGGGGFGGAMSRTREAQVLLTLTTVKTGVQAAVATGSARKKDINWAAGGIGAMMVAGLIGGHQNTDMAKMTAAALLDAFTKLIPSMPSATAAVTTAPPSSPARR